jgi:hypothetical protein
MRLPPIPLPSVSNRRSAVAAVALAMALAAIAWHLLVDRQSVGLADSIGKARQRLADVPTASSAEALSVDFAEGLPISPSIDPIVREFQRATADFGVLFVSVSSTPRVATDQTLGRAELTIVLRGAYPKLKDALKVALDRFPALLLQRLSFRRMATPSDLEARLDLVLLSRPVLASAVGR